MLTINLASKRIPNIGTHYPAVHTPAVQQQSRLTTVENVFNTRDLVIKRELSKIDYKEGDVVRPWRSEDFMISGYGKIRGIVRSYKDWPPTEDFPQSPKLPMIVLVEGLSSKDRSYNCTVNYVRKVTEKELEEANAG
jgi:hypothetical protein